MFHELLDKADPSCVFAECLATMVWIDVSEGSSRPLPDWMRATIQP
jgi:acyl-CoA thioesterase FadM